MENFSESLREGLDLRDLHGARDRANGGATNEDGDATGEDAASSVDLDDDLDDAARKNSIRAQLLYLTQEAFRTDRQFLSKSLAALNREAAAFQKAGDDLSAIASYAKLFAKVRRMRLTHPELYVTHCNRAVAYLNLGLFEEALWDAIKCMQLSERALNRDMTGASTYIKAHAKKGFALLGLERYREASASFNKGLKHDPFNEELKQGLEEAQQAIFADILEGKSLHVRALPAAQEKGKQRISLQPYSAPLHKIRTDDMLPMQLLTPFQAENDYHVKDTYNYVTVQTDIKMPKHHLTYLDDVYRHSRFAEAIRKAVADISEDKDCRVLNLGAGSGLLTMQCLKAGAYHVTAVERWLYLAMSCKEVLLANGFTDEQVKVVYKRPTDLALLSDVPIACNLLVCDILDDGLLTSGIIPAARHALDNLMIDKPIAIPCSATLYVQAGEVYTEDVCGFDLSVMNRHRWMPAFASGVPVDGECFVPLSAPMEVWQFDMLSPPEEAGRTSLDVEFERDGVFNAVRFWYDLHLYDDVHICTGPEAVSSGLKTLRPAIQFLPGQMRVEEGLVLPLAAMHNTVRVLFDLDEAEYISLARPDASFPQIQFAMLHDEGRNEAYYRAIERAVARVKARGEGVHALDMGCGSGLLGMMAARCGADTVVGCELHDGVCDTARHVIARNGLSDKVSIVHSDVGLLKRGEHVRSGGINLAIADIFDCGLLHDNFMFLLEKAKVNVLQSGYAIVPAAATVYCMGIEAHTESVDGFDLTRVNKYRWDAKYEGVDLRRIKHRRLTKPKKVFEYFFGGNETKGRNRENVLKLPIVSSGYMNAIVFWFDLHLDEEESITTAPVGIGLSGVVMAQPEVSDGASAGAGDGSVANQSEGPAHASPECFIPAHAFLGEKKGYVFKKAAQGIGYYVDLPKRPDASALVAADDGEEGEGGDDGIKPHYWGQALQYLERGVRVEAKKKITILAKRDASTIRFALKEGVGEWVGKSPWKIEWGGGASIENPHYQRVHYCQLLVNDFMMRVRCKRFPPIERDLRIMIANGGNLFLDPTHTQDVLHELVLLEALAGQEALTHVDALTKPLLTRF